MDLSGLLPLIRDIPKYQELLEELRGGGEGPIFHYVLRAAKPYLLACLQGELNIPILVLVARPGRANELFEQLSTWSKRPQEILLFPEPDALPFERASWDVDTRQRRLKVLAASAQYPEGNAPPLIIASARALLQMTLPPAEFKSQTRTSHPGQRMAMNLTLAEWYSLGYEPHTIVETPGTFSRRGGILDIFPPQNALPVRIELFGDEIVSLRLFDPTTQRSQEEVPGFTITPASEALPQRGEEAASLLSQLELTSCNPLARRDLRQDLAALGERAPFSGIEFYIPYLYTEPAMMLDYLPSEGLLVIDSLEELEMAVADLESQALKAQADLSRRGELPEGFWSSYLTWDDLRDRLEARQYLALSRSPEERFPFPEDDRFVPAKLYGGQLKRLMTDYAELKAQGSRVIIATRQAQRLAELFEEQWLRFSPAADILEPPSPGSLTLLEGILANGWRMKGEKDLVLLTDAELFGWAVPQPRRVSRRPAPKALPLLELSPGDYVVHIEHGVALFHGLVKQTVNGLEREYLLLEYAAGDKLYVPTYQADRVSPYIGAGSKPPAISRLGTADWEHVKARAKRAVKDIAREMLELYAAREVISGHAFSPDSSWQTELEASFPYGETEDQLRAINEVKTDMERPKPMDRLVCGDVGYGKTEVALRAAFKAVMDDKEVAMLVPTTVLAQQHTRTFHERLEPFPVVVEMLSRFRSRKEQKDLLERLRAGQVDIVIGTHRLLQKDVAFKDLGLLIIDEEQRFGVTHKEKLKQMRREVDVLTMTATPIPRTLYMSLAGVRDMSIIDTPPEDRLPIVTRVLTYDEPTIRQAILRELDRGGQVYFVHNRVRGIRQMAQRLVRIVPEASLAIAHGQMEETKLESVMLRFAEGDFDVLVCTSIIESGLDIPNVNTIIVNRADRFGLSQLYQLRGRVGRSNRRAYAYFLYQKYQGLSDVARRRLETIAEASELGAGFGIAMRDLQIRGAGDLLGVRQHGHIGAVGFDLYCRLLAQAVRELKGQADRKVLREEVGLLRPLRESIQLNLPVDAYLPEGYVEDSHLRLKLYRRLGEIDSLARAEEMAQELEDRFGDLPVPAQNLMYLVRIKTLASEAKVKAISTEAGQLLIKPQDIPEWRSSHIRHLLPPSLRIGRNYLWLPLRKKGEIWREELEDALKAMARVVRTALPHSP